MQGGCYPIPDHTTEDDTLTERIAAQAVFAMEPPDDLPCRVQPLNSRAVLAQDAAIRAYCEPAHAVVYDRRHKPGVVRAVVG